MVKEPVRPFLRPALAGAAATCAGNGLARFAYVPLFPAMVGGGLGGWRRRRGCSARRRWRATSRACSARRAWRRRGGFGLGVPGTLDLGMALVALSLAACAWNGGFWWLMGWRFMAGVAGGLLMALAGPAVQASVPPARRGAAGGVVIAGVGSGVAAGALLVPALLPVGLPATWIGLGAAVLLLWLFAHPRWPDPPSARRDARGRGRAAARAAAGVRLRAARRGHGAADGLPGRPRGARAGPRRSSGARWLWLLFGLGGVAGGVLSGRIVDRLGGVQTLRLWLGVQAAALALSLPPFAAAGAARGAAGRLRRDRRHRRDPDRDAGDGAGAARRALGALHRVLRGGAGGGGLRAGGAVRGDGREPRRGVRRRASPSPRRRSARPSRWARLGGAAHGRRSGRDALLPHHRGPALHLLRQQPAERGAVAADRHPALLGEARLHLGQRIDPAHRLQAAAPRSRGRCRRGRTGRTSSCR